MSLTTSYKMGIAALIMAGSVLLSRFMGLIRDKVISWEFGTTAEADIYFAAFVLPDFINYLLAGGYISITLIPLLSNAFQKNEKNGWKFFSTVFSWALIGIIILTAIAWIFAYDLAKITAPGFTKISQERLAFFLRIILPAQIFFLPGACICALLYIRKQFIAPALMPIIYNGCIIICGVLFTSNGMEGFCWGVVIGAGIGAFCLPLWVAIKNGIHLYFSVYHPFMKRFLLLALPLMLGQSIVVLDEQLIRIFGSLASEGTISLLNYARRIMLVPVGVVAQAVSVASYPFLASLAAKNNTIEFDATLNTALKGSLLIALPLTSWMIAIALPTLGLVFEGGCFTFIQTIVASPLLQVMLLSVPFWVIQQIIGRAFYARQNTIIPAILGTIATTIFIPFFPFIAKSYGGIGIALLTTFSVVTYTGLLSITWSKKFGTNAFSGLKKLFIKSLLLVIPSGIITWATTNIFTSYLQSYPPFLMYLSRLFISLIIFGTSYILFSMLFFPKTSIHLFYRLKMQLLQ